MPNSKPRSALLEAAGAVEDELIAFDELAREAKRVTLDGKKALGRAAKLLEQSAELQESAQGKLRALVVEIEGARRRQDASMATLLDFARTLEGRAREFRALEERFAALAESARAVNTMAAELGARGEAPSGELLDPLRTLEQRMREVAASAEALARDARDGGWSELARMADAARQQVQSASNKLSLAFRQVAERAPS
jgi:hypothetical protein